MLIENEIKRLHDHGRLFIVETLDWRDSQERVVYVSRDLHLFLTRQSANPATNADRRRLQRRFDRFISGQAITVAFNRNIKGSDIKRLSPKGAEVWEFKVQTKLQLRVFGRVRSDRRVIALTGPVDRPNCDYNAEIIRCQQEWHNLLPEHSPIHGSTINDYVSTKGIPL
jgi:hypothetical protein